MVHSDSLLTDDWQATVAALGGADLVCATARDSKAFVRSRVIANPVDLLRLVLAYCLGERGLRLTAAWAAAIGVANISNVGLLWRLQRCEAWLAQLVGQTLNRHAPPACQGRLIRLIDATTVPKAARSERCRNGVWRIHSAFDLPSERFGHFEVTDESGGERLDRIAVVKGEIRIADAAHLQPERIAAVLAGGGDVLVRAAWRNGRWLAADGDPFDMVAAFEASQTGLIDQPVWLSRSTADPLPLRLIARRLPPEAAETARRRARRAAQKKGYTLSDEALIAADWIVLATSLPAAAFSSEHVLALYRLRWRVELAFKRLKSVIGLKGPPGTDPRSARAFILAHLLMIVLLEPLVDAFEDSPHWAIAA
jgi:hypothetical protein